MFAWSLCDANNGLYLILKFVSICSSESVSQYLRIDLILQAVLSVSIKDKVASGVPLVMQLKPLLTFCGLTHIGLITGNDAERLLTTVSKG